jgi:hypothetical protein
MSSTPSLADLSWKFLEPSLQLLAKGEVDEAVGRFGSCQRE